MASSERIQRDYQGFSAKDWTAMLAYVTVNLQHPANESTPRMANAEDNCTI